MSKILIIEDDEKLRNELETLKTEQAIEVKVIPIGES